MSYEASEPGEALKPQFCLEQLRDNAPEGTILVSGVGQHQMWSSQYWRFNEPYTWVNSGGLGTMGFCVPAAIGAKVGRPDRTVWAIDGDGCFQMTAQELVTASVERIPIKVGILNNSYLGMVRQWQEMFYDERYSEVYLSPELPDFVKWAEAMGCVGIRVDSPEEVQPAIDKANSIDDRPVVVDFRVDAREKVFPMVPAGMGNDDLILPDSQMARERAPSSEHRHEPSHPVRARAEPAGCARPGRRAVRPARLQHLLARGRALRRSRVSAASRSSSMSTPRRSSRSPSSCSSSSRWSRSASSIRAVRSNASCCWRRSGVSPENRGQVVELATIFEGKILAVGVEAITISLDGHPDKLDDFEELLTGYGIVELQRTGRVALPKLDREARLRAANSNSKKSDYGKAG